jgi:hypothetical protein
MLAAGRRATVQVVTDSIARLGLVALLLAASTAFGAEMPAPERPFEELEPYQQIRFFESWLGGPLDPVRYEAMWRAARERPSEPAPAFTTGIAAVNAWELVGPLYSTNPGGGRMTGRVRDIDARNNRVLAASGGLWRFNFGPIPMSDSVPASWFGSFATHPSDPNTILLGTGEYIFGMSGTGLYKTTDGGQTWTRATMSPQPSAFTMVRYSPDATVAHATGTTGYFRSTDGGATWTLRLAGTATDLSIVAADPSRVFVTLSGQGLWQSTNGGVTWTQNMGSGLPTSGTGDGAVSAVRHPGTGALWIYVCFTTSVYRSQDGGASWANVSPAYTVGNSTYGPVISACPADPAIVLMGNVPLSRSADGGASWTKIVEADLHADYQAFEWEDDAVGVWAGHDGGWSFSGDRGLNWDSSANVMPVTQFYTVDGDRTSLGYLLGGTQDNNVLYTPNHALFWTDPALGSSEGDAFGVAINQYDPNQMWAVSGVFGAPYAFPRFRTLDGGTTWGQVNSGIDPNNFSGSLRTDNAFPVRLVTSAGPFVYESTDGVNWSKSNPAAFPANVRNLTSSIRVSGGAVLYAALGSTMAGQRLYVRDNGTWYERSAGLPAGDILKVVPHPWFAYADQAWAIHRSGLTYRLFRTDNRGSSWTEVTGDLPTNIAISDLVPNPRADGELVVGTLLGCWLSRNGGVNWERWNNGMPPSAIVTEMTYVDLTTTTGEFVIVAATYGRSMWKRAISGEDPKPLVTLREVTTGEGDEGDTFVGVFATLSAPQSQVVTIDWQTQDGTATAADNDYQAASGTLVFPPGQTTSALYVTVNADLGVEDDEEFTVTLSNPLRATAGPPATVRVLDDDRHRILWQSLIVTDGPVRALVVSGETLFLGGSFSHVGTACGGGVPLDATTGQPERLPRVAGSVLTVIPDGAGGWYLGGLFTHVAGQPRPNLAHVFADGSVDPWLPNPDGAVHALALRGDTLFAGGQFTHVGPDVRNRIAAISRSSGWALGWNPDANGNVLTLALDGGTLYTGGEFTWIGGLTRHRLAALDVASGAATSWNPDASDRVHALLIGGNMLWAAGDFATIGGAPRAYLGAIDRTTGFATAWNAGSNGPVYALAAGAGLLYAGGSFTTIGGQPRSHVAALDDGSALATTWAPQPDGPVFSLAVGGDAVYVGGGYSNIGGLSRSNLAAIDPTTGVAAAWGAEPNAGVSVLALSGNTLFVGGGFNSLGAEERASLAAVNAVTGALASWNPGANGTVYALAAAGGVVYAGGSFTTIGGQSRSRIAALDATSGTPTAWNPGANGTVRALLVSGTRVYAGGQFSMFGGEPRSRSAAAFISDGSLAGWDPNANSTVHALASDGSAIYAGGAFSSIGGQPRNGVAMLSTSSGAATAWNPSPNGPVFAIAVEGANIFVGGDFTAIAGQPRGRAALLSTTALGSWNPGANGAVVAIAPNGNEVYVGGSFTSIAGVSRGYLALSRVSTSQVSSWKPSPDDEVLALVRHGTSLFAGGSFRRIGNLPLTYLAGTIPLSLVDAPYPRLSATATLRLAPSPTTGRVRIEYTLPRDGRVTISLYDVQGRRAGVAVDAHLPAGRHVSTWDASGSRAVPPGLYFVRLDAGGEQVVRRLAVTR